eukprot:Colp12_sorted_trinity150504_noHs@26569
MILLEFHNRIIEDTLNQRFFAPAGTKHESIDIVVADFDSVTFHISTPEKQKNRIRISISMSCFSELQAHGVNELLQREYGSALVDAEEGYSASIEYDLDNLPADKEGTIKKAALLKRNCIAAVYEKYFTLQESKDYSQPGALINYRSDEFMYVKAESDRVTVIFSTTFKDDDDIIIGKVFLQEFVDARRNVQQAPQVLYMNEPPKELDGLNVRTGKNVGYVTFVLFPRHFKKETRDESINLIMTFRDYLHYHIKCAKAYLHSRLRARVAASLKILNRARPEEKTTEKKTASGKTFQRKV